MGLEEQPAELAQATQLLKPASVLQTLRIKPYACILHLAHMERAAVWQLPQQCPSKQYRQRRLFELPCPGCCVPEILCHITQAHL